MASNEEPRLLFSISGVTASEINHGDVSSLTPSGPQTLSLLMVPTNSPFDDLSTTIPREEVPEQDFYLHLHLPPELELPLPATTQIYHQPPRNYLLPRWDRGPESGAFTRIEFPEKASQEDIDTFETILAQCTAFLERAPPPTGDAKHSPYNPAEWAPGGKFGAGKTEPGHIVLVDEEDGSVVGQLAGDANVVEDPSLAHGSKDPVEISISEDGTKVEVKPISEDYLAMSRMPQYQNSSIVQNAAAASRLIVTSTGYITGLMSSGAESFSKKTKPVQKPLTFSPQTHSRVRKVHTFSEQGRAASQKTIGSVTKYAQNIGAAVTKKGPKTPKGFDKDGKPIEGYKPSYLNKSMIAFTTIADGIAESSRSILTQGSASASSMVAHRYGEEAGSIAGNLAGGVRNVGLVYIDVTGVSRRAVIKSVAKGMVVGQVKGGGQVIVGGGDGGEPSPANVQQASPVAQAGKPPNTDYGEYRGAGSARLPNDTQLPAYSPGENRRDHQYFGEKR